MCLDRSRHERQFHQNLSTLPHLFLEKGPMPMVANYYQWYSSVILWISVCPEINSLMSNIQSEDRTPKTEWTTPNPDIILHRLMSEGQLVLTTDLSAKSIWHDSTGNWDRYHYKNILCGDHWINELPQCLIKYHCKRTQTITTWLSKTKQNYRNCVSQTI